MNWLRAANPERSPVRRSVWLLPTDLPGEGKSGADTNFDFVSYSERITFNPQMMGGQACVRGMRIPVSLVLNLMAQELPHSDILREYPDLELEDLQACLSYGAWLAREEVLPHQAQF